MATYRVSSLAFALVRMWRGWTVLLPVVLVNAAVQGLLVLPAHEGVAAPVAGVVIAVSAVTLWLSFGLVAAMSLHVARGRVGWNTTLHALRAHLLNYLLWSLAWAVAVTLGLALDTVPGVAVMALTPFVMLAAIDGERNALMANMRVIGARFWRWLVTVLIVGLAAFVLWLAAGFTSFFVRGPVATMIIWTLGGLVLAWFITGFALIYRSVRAGASQV